MNIGRDLAAARRIRGALICLLLASCGGGGGDGGGNNGPPPLNIAAATLNDGVVGTAYSQAIVVSGGTGARTYAVSGALPAGLSLTAGTIGGIPTGPPGTSEFTVSVSDSGSPVQTDSGNFSIMVADPIAVDVGSAPFATVGQAYSHTIGITGGVPPYHVLATLPSGLSIDSDGVISGTPLADAVTAKTQIQVIDSANPQQGLGLDFRLPVTLEVATTALPDATGGVSYSAQILAQGGLPSLTWEMTGGNIPLLFFANGTAHGTPDASCTSATSTLDVRVTDSDTPTQSATRQGIALTVNPGELTIPASSAPPVGSVGAPYSYQIGVTPGVAPFTFAVTAGSLPSQMALNTTDGLLFGAPNAAGTSNFTIQVTDDCGSTASKPFSIVIRGAPQGRNDSIATATPIGNGTIIGSISPSGEPNSMFAPDQDYYAVQTTRASVVTVNLDGIGGGIDTVLEIVDSSGTRLNSCGTPGFTSECMNDDQGVGSLDSFLELSVGGPRTVYLHVVEWRGDARPDLRYRLEISGVN